MVDFTAITTDAVAERVQLIQNYIEIDEPYSKLVDLEDPDNEDFDLAYHWVIHETGVVYVEYDKRV